MPYTLTILCLLVATALSAQNFKISAYAGGGTFTVADQVEEFEFASFQARSNQPGPQTAIEVSSAFENIISFEPISYFQLGSRIDFPSESKWSFYAGLRLDRIELRPEERFEVVSQRLTGNTREIVIPEPMPDAMTSDCPPSLFNRRPEPTLVRQVRLGLPFGLRRVLIPDRTAIYLEGVVAAPVFTATDGEARKTQVSSAFCFSSENVPLPTNLYTSLPAHVAVGMGVELALSPAWRVQLGAERTFTQLLENADLGRGLDFSTIEIRQLQPLFFSLSGRYTFG